MALIDQIRAVVLRLGRPASAVEIAPQIERSGSTVTTTLLRAEWPKASPGAYYPPDRTPALLTDKELRVIKAMRAGQRIDALTEQEGAVVDALRGAA